MNVGSLFSGIGGLDHGLARAGFRHRFFCEQDPWRRSVLSSHWPGVPVYEDVRDVGVRDLQSGLAAGGNVTAAQEEHERAGDGFRPERVGGDHPVDLLCGGFPCQDLSVAGKRAGLQGERSGLFHEFARIIDALQPRWVLIENVPGLLSSNGGRDFGIVLGTLADLGYGVGWRVLDSRFFGVPQRRRRVFIVGAVAGGDPRAAAERAGQVLAVGSRCPGHPPAGGEARPEVAVASLSGLGTGGPDDNDGQGGRLIANTLRANGKDGGRTDKQPMVAYAGHGEGEAQVANALKVPSHGASWSGSSSDTFVAGTLREHVRPGSNTDASIVQGASVRRLTPTECERLQALPDNWTNPDGTAPDSRRYAGLGDAVTSSVGEWIGRRIKEAA